MKNSTATLALESAALRTTEAEFARLTGGLLEEFARRSLKIGERAALAEAHEWSAGAGWLLLGLLEALEAEGFTAR
jgi:hypothetical protein|tara:strand:+ start:1457 stop:1684 length:228 start_codon:yes stop_codon:yes gene_type:complete